MWKRNTLRSNLFQKDSVKFNIRWLVWKKQKKRQ